MKTANHKKYVCNLIYSHLKGMFKQKQGVLSARNIEYIHDMRVASRRLRTALWSFREYFLKEKVRYWNKSIDRVSDILGKARDLDTQIDFLKVFKRKTPSSYKDGMGDLISILKKKRSLQQSRVINALKHLEEKKISEEIKQALRELHKDFHKEDIQSMDVLVGKRIIKRLKVLYKRVPLVYRPGNVEELHLVRVAAKQLRYALEIFRSLLGKEIDIFIDSARRTQRLLGRLHDFDVWIQSLPEVIAGKRSRELKKATRYFIKYCRTQRLRTYKEFIIYWGQLEKKKLWNNLEKFVSSLKRKR